MEMRSGVLYIKEEHYVNDEIHILFPYYTWQLGLNPLGRRLFLGNLISTIEGGKKEKILTLGNAL